MKKLTFVVAAVAALAASTARAEEPRRFSIAPLVGAYVPTGDQRDLLEDSVLAGLTVSYDVHPNVAVVGGFTWAPTRTKGVLGRQDLDLLQYDLGVQGQAPILLAPGWTLKPFVGVGVGGRTYEFRNVSSGGQTDFAGYVSAGAGLEYQAVELRLTARDYLSAFDGLGNLEVSSTARNDLSMFGSVGLRF